MTSAQEHAERQAALYEVIWSADANYGTREVDVIDTVRHRIAPHMIRLGGAVEIVVDYGAGDGRFLWEMHDAGLMVHGVGVDLHAPSYARVFKWLTWFKEPLWDESPIVADYAISTDTLEHMPTEMVPAVLKRIAGHAHGFLRISTKQDIYGTERGLHLHETVRPPDWWLAAIDDAGITATSWRVYPGYAIEVWF